MKSFKKIFFAAAFSFFSVFLSALVLGHATLAQESPVTVESSNMGGPNVTAAQILSLLQELNAIQLNDSIFSDPMFLSLKDYHVDLAEEPKQRSNPFAPIGQDAAVPENIGTSASVPAGGTPIL